MGKLGQGGNGDDEVVVAGDEKSTTIVGKGGDLLVTRKNPGEIGYRMQRLRDLFSHMLFVATKGYIGNKVETYETNFDIDMINWIDCVLSLSASSGTKEISQLRNMTKYMTKSLYAHTNAMKNAHNAGILELKRSDIQKLVKTTPCDIAALQDLTNQLVASKLFSLVRDNDPMRIA